MGAFPRRAGAIAPAGQVSRSDNRSFSAGDGLLKVKEQQRQQARRLEEHHGRDLAGGGFFPEPGVLGKECGSFRRHPGVGA